MSFHFDSIHERYFGFAQPDAFLTSSTSSITGKSNNSSLRFLRHPIDLGFFLHQVTNQKDDNGDYNDCNDDSDDNIISHLWFLRFQYASFMQQMAFCLA